jgi:hypothetical protein
LDLIEKVTISSGRAQGNRLTAAQHHPHHRTRSPAVVSARACMSTLIPYCRSPPTPLAPLFHATPGSPSPYLLAMGPSGPPPLFLLFPLREQTQHKLPPSASPRRVCRWTRNLATRSCLTPPLAPPLLLVHSSTSEATAAQIFWSRHRHGPRPSVSAATLALLVDWVLPHHSHPSPSVAGADRCRRGSPELHRHIERRRHHLNPPPHRCCGTSVRYLPFLHVQRRPRWRRTGQVGSDER